MPHLFVPVIFKSCYVCRYPLPSSAWIAIIATSNHMEYALLRCPFIFVKRMKNRFRSELYSAVLFCRDALDFGYFSVLFVHVLGRGGEGHIFVEAFSWLNFVAHIFQSPEINTSDVNLPTDTPTAVFTFSSIYREKSGFSLVVHSKKNIFIYLVNWSLCLKGTKV